MTQKQFLIENRPFWWEIIDLDGLQLNWHDEQ